MIATRAPETVTKLKALLVLALLVGAVSVGLPSGAAEAAKPRPPAANGIEVPGSPQWPSVAAQLAKNIARASFAHQYDRVWGYLHPTYRQAVSQSRWNRCQSSHPAAPRQVTIVKVSVANATELPVALSLLGLRNVQEIELVVQYKTPGVTGPQLASLDTFWLEQGHTWRAVWPSDEYRSYKAGHCYLTPAGPPLY
jgi:hypothetical protein